MSDILNRKAFSDWANERRQLGHDLAAIKGFVPGQFYSDGEPVTRPMNVGWKDVVTGEVFAFEFDLPDGRAIALLRQEVSDEKWLRQAAEEIRKEGHYGWGNTCEQAADRIA
jgi:hypothetical protein